MIPLHGQLAASQKLLAATSLVFTGLVFLSIVHGAPNRNSERLESD